MRRLPCLLGIALLLVVAPARTRAAGTIDTAGATLTAGAAPTPGTVTIDPSAPAASPPAFPEFPPLGTIGTFSSPLPAFPGGGTGAGGVFDGTTTQTIAGGTYQFTSWQVGAGVEITYDGPTTILVTGDATVSGTVTMGTADASLVIRCAGTFSLNTDALIRAHTDGGSVTVDAGRGFAGAASARINATIGDVSVTTHGADADPGDIVLAGTTLNSSTGDVLARAAGTIGIWANGRMNTSTGNLLLQAFGGDVAFTTPANGNISTGTTGITVEAAGSVAFDGGSAYLNTGAGRISVSALGGDVTLENGGRMNTSNGDIVLRAARHVGMTGASRLNTSTGNHSLTAFGGDVTLSLASATINASTGDITLAASRDVLLGGSTTLNNSTGAHAIYAHGGSVRFSGIVSTNTSSDRALTIRAADAVTGSGLDANNGSIVVAAGAGGVSLDLESASANDGSFTVVALGPVVLIGSPDVKGSATIVSCDDDVDVRGLVLVTDSLFETGSSSGTILIESFAGDAGAIDAAGAAFVTGAADVRSGDILLLVHAGKGAAAIESFFLPKRVKAKANAADPARSRLVAAGFFDTGPDPVDLTGAATLDVGGATFEIAGLTPKGNAFVHDEPGLLFLVKPTGSGSSRAKFRLVRTADLAGEIDMESTLRLHFTGGGVDADGVVDLDAGAYGLGRVRGALVAPNLYLAKVRAKLGGAGRDSFALRVGLATDGATPGEAPDLTVSFGSKFLAMVVGTEFTRSGDRYVFTGQTGGITKAVLDYARETLTVVAKGVTLGDFPDGASAVQVGVTLGADARAARVRMVRGGSSLKY